MVAGSTGVCGSIEATACRVTLSTVRAANLALKFVLELVALALLGIWGWRTGHGPWSIVLAVLAPTALILVWGRFAAPRSPTRFAARARIPLEVSLFAIAAIAGCFAQLQAASLVFAVLVVLNAAGLTAFSQWDS